MTGGGRRTAPVRARLLLGLGIACGAVGLLLSPPCVAFCLGYAEGIGDPVLRRALLTLQAALLTTGVGLVLLRRREAGVRLALVALCLLIAVPLAGELIFRAGIAAGSPTFRDPRLYAGWCDDEDQWRLRYRWVEDSRSALEVSGFHPHELFGWAGPEPELAEAAGSPVLLFGDSYLHGVGPNRPSERIPALLGERMATRAVLDYGTPGYGLDQIFLRFRETHRRFADPATVIGIMTLDLDRSLFAVRDAPKPYFTLRDGRLELRGVPVPPDPAAWHQRHPPAITSYLAAFLMRRLRLAGHVHETEIPYRQGEKKALNRAILQALADEAEDHDRRILLVLFYPSWELGYEGWRERFLRRELDWLGLPYLDTKPLFLAHGGTEALYLPPPNGHPNATANRLVADEIARRLEAYPADGNGSASGSR